MIRVLKITSGLMGVLLLLMVGVMGVGRYGKEGLEQLILNYQDNHVWKRGLFYPEYDYLRPLATHPCGGQSYRSIVHISRDRQWIYVDGCYEDGEGGTPLERISLTGSRKPELIIPGYISETLHWTSDEQWIVYLYERDGEAVWARVRADGSEQKDLSTGVRILLADGQRSYFSPDEQWIYVTGLSETPDVSDEIFRLSFDGEAQENLTAQNEAQVRLGDEVFSDGFGIEVDHEPHKMSFDGQISELPPSGPPILAHLPSKNLEIVGPVDTYGARGIDMTTGQTIWEADGVFDVVVSPNEEWLFLRNTSQYTEYMQWDGSERQYFVGFASRQVWSRDKRWLFYATPIESGWELRRIAANTLEVETLFVTNEFYMDISGFSSDGQWIIFKTQTETSTTYRVHLDGSQLQPLRTLDPYYFAYVEDVGPVLNRHWQPAILAAIALTFIATPILLSHLRRRFHPAPIRNI